MKKTLKWLWENSLGSDIHVKVWVYWLVISIGMGMNFLIGWIGGRAYGKTEAMIEDSMKEEKTRRDKYVELTNAYK